MNNVYRDFDFDNVRSLVVLDEEKMLFYDCPVIGMTKNEFGIYIYTVRLESRELPVEFVCDPEIDFPCIRTLIGLTAYFDSVAVYNDILSIVVSGHTALKSALIQLTNTVHELGEQVFPSMPRLD